MTLKQVEQIAEQNTGWGEKLSAELTKTYRTCDCSGCYWRGVKIRKLMRN